VKRFLSLTHSLTLACLILTIPFQISNLLSLLYSNRTESENNTKRQREREAMKKNKKSFVAKAKVVTRRGFLQLEVFLHWQQSRRRCLGIPHSLLLLLL